MFTPEIPLYKPLTPAEKGDIVTIARASKEITDWVQILLSGLGDQDREKVISNILKEVKKIKSTTIEA